MDINSPQLKFSRSGEPLECRVDAAPLVGSMAEHFSATVTITVADREGAPMLLFLPRGNALRLAKELIQSVLNGME